MSAPNLSISVIMPVYNGAAFLPEAMACIRRQTQAPLEILIVDDGSTDATAAIAAKLDSPVRVFSQENKGPASARNRALAEARGEFVAFLDVDDLWPDTHLATMLSYFQKEPHRDVVMGLVQYQRIDAAATRDLSKPGFWFQFGCGMFRRAVFTKVGPFDASLRFGEDADWFMRAIEKKISLLVVDEVALFYRLHGNNMTAGRSASELNFIKVIKRSLDRRRGDDGTPTKLPSVDFASSRARKDRTNG